MSTYHELEVAKEDQNSDRAFHAIMELVRGSLTAQQQEQLIKLYVDATHAKFWEGWHSHGLAMSKVSA